MNKKLYIVATPIGNLKDITIRAIEVLKESSCIICENPIKTKKLLNYYKIESKRLFANPAGREKFQLNKIEKILKNNDIVSLVSDAGTPLINDPGKYILKIAKENSFDIIPIPGASAITSVLSICPLLFSKFVYLGFLPKKGNKKINDILGFINQDIAVCFLSNGKQLIKTLEKLFSKQNDAQVFIAKELTKINEQNNILQCVEKLLELKDSGFFEKGEFIAVIAKDKNKEKNCI